MLTVSLERAVLLKTLTTEIEKSYKIRSGQQILAGVILEQQV